MKSKSFIYFALARWDGPYASTAFSIAQELSSENRVFYIENPFTLKDVIAGFWKKIIYRRIPALLFGIKPIQPIQENLFIVTPLAVLPINWMPDGWLYRKLLNFNNRIVFWSVRITIKRFNLQDYIYYNSFNPFYGLTFPRSFKPALTIYQSVDKVANSHYVKKHGPALEAAQIKKADFTVVTSTNLKQQLSIHSSEIHLVPNAADIELFSRAGLPETTIPNDIEDIRGKVITYIGNICDRVDYDILSKITSEEGLHLLLIGPVSTKNKTLEKLSLKENVTLTGPKPMAELPGYLKGTHCAIIPFLCNELTAGIYPLKINEYLAAGVPVVSTSFSSDILNFKEVIYLAHHAEGFVEGINRSIKANNDVLVQERKRFTRNNTWRNRADQIMGLIGKYESNK